MLVFTNAFILQRDHIDSINSLVSLWSNLWFNLVLMISSHLFSFSLTFNTEVYKLPYSWPTVPIGSVHLYRSWVDATYIVYIPELCFVSKYSNKTVRTVNQRVLGCGFWVSRMSMMHRIRTILKGIQVSRYI